MSVQGSFTPPLHTKDREHPGSILLELSKIQPDDMAGACAIVTEKISHVTGLDRTSIWWFNEGRDMIYCYDMYLKSSREHIRESSILVSSCPRYHAALEHSRGIAAKNAREDPRTSELLSDYMIPKNICSMLDTPIRIDGKLVGLICNEAVGIEHDWTLEEQEFCASVAEITSTLFQTIHLKKAQKALQDYEVKFSKIVDNSLIPIFKSNPEGRFRFLNPAMRQLLEMDSLSKSEHFTTHDFFIEGSHTTDLIQLLTDSGVARDLEIQVRTLRGNHKTVLINAFIEEEDTVGMMLDITDRKLAEDEIRRSHELASESARLKTSLLANMSHEFRTPMNAILGFADLISQEANDPELVFYARKIHGAGNRLMATLKSILDLADLEATRSKLKLKELDLQPLISEVMHPFLMAANEKSLFLISEFSNNLTVLCDDNLLRIILNNIIDNAIKFTQKGGVTIETEILPKDEGNHTAIRIKDTGIGIPHDQIDMIFHEFRQVSEGYNRSYEGTGLGLTLARKMAEMVDVKILVESEPGLGSIFTILVPNAGGTPQSSTIPAFSKEPHARTTTFNLHPPESLPRILVVEDNEDNAEIIKLYLKGKCTIDRANEGFSAIKMAKASKYAAILMDINLGPGMDGLKTAQEIRKLTSYKNIPICAITGYTMDGDCEKLLAGGCSHYLGKPFSQQSLLNIFNQIFSSEL